MTAHMANEPEETAREDGTLRRQHYGAGKQPWDTIVDLGWGPVFAAANVVKYLRRTKDTEHSHQSARWYFDRLDEMVRTGDGLAEAIQIELVCELNVAEMNIVRGTKP